MSPKQKTLFQRIGYTVLSGVMLAATIWIGGKAYNSGVLFGLPARVDKLEINSRFQEKKIDSIGTMFKVHNEVQVEKVGNIIENQDRIEQKIDKLIDLELNKKTK